MIIDFNKTGGGGSGSGGSVVSVTQLLSAGTPSATITVDGQATTIYSNETSAFTTQEQVEQMQDYRIVGNLNEITNPVEGMVAVVNTYSAETRIGYHFVISGDVVHSNLNPMPEEIPDVTMVENDTNDYTINWIKGTEPNQYFIVYTYEIGGIPETHFIRTPETEYGFILHDADYMTGVTQSGVTEHITDETVEIDATYLGEFDVITASSSIKYVYTNGVWVADKTKTEYYTWDALTAMTVAERTALKDRISAGTLVIVAYQNGEDTEYHFPSQMNYTQPQGEDGKWLMWRMEKGMGRSRCLRIQWNTTEYQAEDEEPSYPPTYYKIAEGDETIGSYEDENNPNVTIYSDFEAGYMIAKKGNNLPPMKDTTVPRYSFDFDPSEATDGDVIFTLEDGNGQIATVYYFDDNGTNKIGFSAETQDYDWITDGELDLDDVLYRYNLLVIGEKPYTSVKGCIGGRSILLRHNYDYENEAHILGITVTEDAYTEAFSEYFSIIPNDQLEYGIFNDEYDFRLDLEQSLYYSEPVKLNDYEYDYENEWDTRRLRRINPVSSDQIRNIVKLTQAEYDDLEQAGEIREDTLYLIEEE